MHWVILFVIVPSAWRCSGYCLHLCVSICSDSRITTTSTVGVGTPLRILRILHFVSEGLSSFRSPLLFCCETRGFLLTLRGARDQQPGFHGRLFQCWLNCTVHLAVSGHTVGYPPLPKKRAFCAVLRTSGAPFSTDPTSSPRGDNRAFQPFQLRACVRRPGSGVLLSAGYRPRLHFIFANLYRARIETGG